ncbi:hypothetical protein GCM10022381_11000 [Leifsonia kafniensis]|uniref:Cobalamin biosynthesis protein CbiX n=1 Tax=Leifsonia kafniensis TaxID=475957 RepID=A0ABP7K8R4_9MICO
MTATLTHPALVAISHGTSSPDGQAAVAALVDAVAYRRPDLDISGGFVDVQQPDVAATLGALDPHMPAVIVPLLLSAGYHVHVDLVVESAEADRDSAISAALGPDTRLIDVLEMRLLRAGYREGDSVVMAAAGSSDARAVDDCVEVGRMLSARLLAPVTVGFISAATPRLADAVQAVRSARPTRRVIVSTYLLAPGYFASLCQNGGADVVTDPLLLASEHPPASLVELVLDRYRAVHEGYQGTDGCALS